jgi:hypothetical protein
MTAKMNINATDAVTENRRCHFLTRCSLMVFLPLSCKLPGSTSFLPYFSRQNNLNRKKWL